MDGLYSSQPFWGLEGVSISLKDMEGLIRMEGCKETLLSSDLGETSRLFELVDDFALGLCRQQDFFLG